MKTKKRFFFKKNKKLKKKDFIYKNLKIINSKLFILKIKNNNLNFPRLGLIIKKKIFKYSIIRNKIKRLIVNNFRIKQYKLHNYDYILTIKEIFLKLNKKKKKNYINLLWKTYYK